MQFKYFNLLFFLSAFLFTQDLQGQCAGPDSIVISRIQATNATFNWDMSEATGYTLELGVAGFTPGTGTRLTTADTTITFTALFEKTAFDAYLYSSCANGSMDTVSLKGFETLYFNDLGVTLLDAPRTGCDLSNSEDITIGITNFGENPHQLVEFGYSIDDIEGSISRPFDGVYTGIVGFDSTVTTTFDVRAQIGSPGEYKFKVWTQLGVDQDVSNDTFEMIITHQPVIQDYPYEWDFEIWKGGWLVDEESSMNSSWDFGRPNSPDIPTVASGKAAWVTNLIGAYKANEKSVLISPCFDFSGMTNDPYMSFALHYDGEECCDFAIAEISINAGRNWTKIGDGENGINWYNNNDSNQWDGAGVTNGWSRVQNRLFGAAGRDSVRIRYIFESDGSTQGSGIGVDDIHIYEPYNVDAAVAVIDHTSEIECGESNDSVLVAIENTGLTPLTSYIVSYSLNGAAAINQTINQPLAVSERDTIVLATAINTAMDGAYNLRAWVAAPGDLYESNDTLFTDFNIEGGTPLPLREDFEGSDFPMGWRSNNMSFGIDHGSPTSVYFANLNGTRPSFELASPNVGAISMLDTLKFEYRVVNTNGSARSLQAGDQIEIQISEDCGLTYTTVFTIDQSNDMTSADLALIKVSLEDYVNKDIKVRWLGASAGGDYFVDLDNISIIACPSSLDLTSSQKAASSATTMDGAITINAGNGTGPYSYDWNSGQSTATVSDISSGSYSIQVTDALGCTDMISVDLLVCQGLGLTVNTTKETIEGNDGTAMVVATTGSGPFTYAWETGVETDMIFDLAMGSYTVTVTDANGCSETALATIDLETSNQSIPDLEVFGVYPNPADFMLNVDFELAVSNEAVFEVFNSIGQVVYQERRASNRRHEFDIETTNWVDGLYFARIRVGEDAITKRVIIQH